MIPGRCCHCGDIIKGMWDAHNVLYTTCVDCSLWHAYLWQQQPPLLVDYNVLLETISEAMAEGLE